MAKRKFTRRSDKSVRRSRSKRQKAVRRGRSMKRISDKSVRRSRSKRQKAIRRGRSMKRISDKSLERSRKKQKRSKRRGVSVKRGGAVEGESGLDLAENLSPRATEEISWDDVKTAMEAYIIRGKSPPTGSAIEKALQEARTRWINRGANGILTVGIFSLYNVLTGSDWIGMILTIISSTITMIGQYSFESGLAFVHYFTIAVFKFAYDFLSGTFFAAYKYPIGAIVSLLYAIICNYYKDSTRDEINALAEVAASTAQTQPHTPIYQYIRDNIVDHIQNCDGNILNLIRMLGKWADATGTGGKIKEHFADPMFQKFAELIQTISKNPELVSMKMDIQEATLRSTDNTISLVIIRLRDIFANFKIQLFTTLVYSIINDKKSPSGDADENAVRSPKPALAELQDEPSTSSPPQSPQFGTARDDRSAAQILTDHLPWLENILDPRTRTLPISTAPRITLTPYEGKAEIYKNIFERGEEGGLGELQSPGYHRSTTSSGLHDTTGVPSSSHGRSQSQGRDQSPEDDGVLPAAKRQRQRRQPGASSGSIGSESME